MTVGQLISAHVVKARWAYFELASERFGPAYAGSGPQHLFDAARAGEPFSKLDASDHHELVRMLNFARPGPFAAVVDTSPLYRCKALTAEQLSQLWALPSFGLGPTNSGIQLMDFFHKTYGAGNVPSAGDPRSAAATGKPLPADHEPVIVIRTNGRHVLLEGYSRAVAFMSATNTADRLLAWFPWAIQFNRTKSFGSRMERD